MSNIIFVKSNHTYVKKSIILKNLVIKDAIMCIQDSPLHIAFVVDQNKKLIGTITDGDIRRGLLKGFDLETNISKIVFKNPSFSYIDKNLSIPSDIMIENNLRQIPILHKDKTISGVFFYKDIIETPIFKNKIVVMAGGEGKRMRPLTIDKPKPMIEIKDKPIIQHIIDNAKSLGFYNFIISIKYKGSVIKNYFNKNTNLSKNINLNYLSETKPLGTAGCLSLIKKKLSKPFIVINGDIITKINLSQLLEFHIEQKAMATIVIKDYIIENPFGVVNLKDNKIVKLIEKPIYKTNVMAGIYVFDPSVTKYLKKNNEIDMPTFINTLIKLNKKILAFPIHEKIYEFGKIIDIKNYS